MAESTKNPHDGKGHDVNPGVSHERRDVNVFQISAFGIGLLLACIVTVFAMWAMFDFLFQREDAKNATNPAASMMNQRPKLPPEPRLQREPKIELKDLRADEDAIPAVMAGSIPIKGLCEYRSIRRSTLLRKKVCRRSRARLVWTTTAIG